MRKFICLGFLLLIGCQKDVTVQQPPSTQNNIIVPGRNNCPPPNPGGIHIDINSRPGYHYCNHCKIWIKIGSSHHCR